MRLKLSDIEIDRSLSPRDHVIESKVQELVYLGQWSEDVTVRENAAGAKRTWTLVDGFNRYEAAKRLGWEEIDASQEFGDWEIAAVKLNLHGTPLEYEDRHRWFDEHLAVKSYENGGHLSQTDLALALGVSRPTINAWLSEYRRSQAVKTDSNAPVLDEQPDATRNVAHPQRSALYAEYTSDPDATYESVGIKHDLSPGTVRALIDREKAHRFTEDRRKRKANEAPTDIAVTRQPDFFDQWADSQWKRKPIDLTIEWLGAAEKMAVAAIVFSDTAHQHAIAQDEQSTPAARVKHLQDQLATATTVVNDISYALDMAINGVPTVIEAES